jgi:hypothetical protein
LRWNRGDSDTDFDSDSDGDSDTYVHRIDDRLLFSTCLHEQCTCERTLRHAGSLLCGSADLHGCDCPQPSGFLFFK